MQFRISSISLFSLCSAQDQSCSGFLQRVSMFACFQWCHTRRVQLEGWCHFSQCHCRAPGYRDGGLWMVVGCWLLMVGCWLVFVDSYAQYLIGWCCLGLKCPPHILRSSLGLKPSCHLQHFVCCFRHLARRAVSCRGRYDCMQLEGGKKAAGRRYAPGINIGLL